MGFPGRAMRVQVADRGSVFFSMGSGSQLNLSRTHWVESAFTRKRSSLLLTMPTIPLRTFCKGAEETFGKATLE